ncbi:hypothetical protein JZU71_02950, partial [bacterium]|nr:hypothetical protein [bacterium]
IEKQLKGIVPHLKDFPYTNAVKTCVISTSQLSDLLSDCRTQLTFFSFRKKSTRPRSLYKA